MPARIAPVPRPYRFVAGVILGWAVLRIALLIHTPAAIRAIPADLVPGGRFLFGFDGPSYLAPPAPVAARPARTPVRPLPPAIPTAIPPGPAGWRYLPRAEVRRRTFQAGARLATTRLPFTRAARTALWDAALLQQASWSEAPRGLASLLSDAEALAPRPAGTSPSRLTGSAWLFLRRGDNGGTLARAPGLGGSQAGARIAFRPVDSLPVAVAARVSAAIDVPQTEAAIGVEARPWARIPVTFALERRIAVDRGGRDAWTGYLAGGVDAVPLPGGFQLDGYAQAGVVGVRSRDGFVDGAVRVGRGIPGAADRLSLNVGAFGAVQPGARRLDIGPGLVARLPVGRTAIRIAAEWRFRVAGNAAPGNGPALTVATGF